eukprot:g2885.t1
MRVTSTLTCFAAVGPLLRAPLPFVTTATRKNDASTHLPSSGEKRRGSASIKGSSICIQFGSLRTQTKHKNNSFAVVTRGGAVSKTRTNSTVFKGAETTGSSICSQSGGLRTHTKHNKNGFAVMTRGGATSETQTTVFHRIKAFMNARFFLLGAATMVISARLAPSFGTKGGMLSLAVSKAGVSVVFFLVGLAIKLDELKGAALNFRLNLLTQLFSLGALPLTGLGLSRVLAAGGMHPALADGVLILMALPTTVNMCVILTQSAEGNTAAAAFNAVLGNLLGVVVTPALLLLFLGRRLDMAPSLLATFKKLGIKVVLPLALGQLARLTPLRKLRERKPKAISRLSECVLLSIIYTTFCDTFADNAGVAVTGAAAGGGGGGVLVLMAVLPVVHILSLAAVDALSRLPFLKIDERDRIAAMFCGTHKTLAFGIPLIKALFDGHPSLGMLATPLLLFHPLELMLGSALAPTLRSRADSREAEVAATTAIGRVK